MMFSRIRLLIWFFIPLLTLGGGGGGLLLRLRNGDWLAGDLSAFSGGELLFQPRWSLDAVRVPLPQVAELHRTDGGEAEREIQDAVEVLLTNGDRFHARLREMDGDILHMEATDGTPLRLRRAYVHSLRIPQASGLLLLAAPLRPGDWIYHSGIPDSSRPRLQARGALPLPYRNQRRAARALPPLPKQFQVEFEFVPGTMPFVFAVTLFGPDPAGRMPGGIYMQVSHGVLFVQTTHAVQAPPADWRANIELKEDVPARFRMFVDLTQAKAHLFLNDSLLKTWDYPFAEAFHEKPQRWFSFRLPTNTSHLLLSNLRVEHWNGGLPPADFPFEPEQDLLILRNGSTLSGKWIGAAGNTLFVRTQTRPRLALPLSEVAEYRSAPLSQRLPRRRAGDAAIHFGARGDRLTLLPRGIEEERLQGTGDAWALAPSIPLASLQKVRFHLYEDGILQETPLSLDLDKPLLRPIHEGAAP